MLRWVTWCLFRTPKRFVYEGSFTLNGAAAATSPKGTGWSVRRTAQGTYVVTFDQSFKQLVSAHVSLAQATGANDVANAVTFSNGSSTANATLTIETQSSAGTNADLAAGTVHFTAVFTNADLTAPTSTSV